MAMSAKHKMAKEMIGGLNNAAFDHRSETTEVTSKKPISGNALSVNGNSRTFPSNVHPPNDDFMSRM